MIPSVSIAPSSLAIHGGQPVRTKPFPFWPQFADDEIAAVVEVMRSGLVNYWTGSQGQDFEREFARVSGSQHSVAVVNGTIALELGLRSLGIASGDDVVTSSRTFIASASSISMCGARPIFADVDRDSQNVTAETIRAALTAKTRALLVVHLGGWPCDMDPILELTRERNLFVIEDCAQAQGATYKGRPVGSFGDVAAFSFCQDKIMSSLGEGGMLTTSDAGIWQCAWSLKDHGRTHESLQPGNGRGFRWIHETIGTNARMTEAQAAVGRLQLRKITAWLENRRSNARMMCDHLAALPALRVPKPDSHIESAYYRFYAFVRPDKLRSGWDRDRIVDAINWEGIPCFVGSCGEVYMEKAFADSRPPERLPVARELAETSLAFLVHPTVCEEDIDDTCRAVEKVMSAASLG